MSKKVTKYDYPSSETGGVKPMNIRGLFEDERMRLSEEFTDEERKWRKQWLKDQKLSPNEPRPPSEEWIKLTRNPIRRFLSKPFQFIEDKLTPFLGKESAKTVRYASSRGIAFIAGVYFVWYHLKYHQNDWTRAYGPSLLMPKPVTVPGDENFPAKRERFDPDDYWNRGFKSRNVFKDE